MIGSSGMNAKEDKPITVLLAEDDREDCHLFGLALTEADSRAKLVTVEDGDKLMRYLSKVDAEYPDFIFLDINMPCKSGKECLIEIRSNKKFQNIPVIMFTTSYFKAEIEETFENGANLFVSKLIFFNDEVNILKRIFSPRWKRDLLTPDRKNFVLQATNSASRSS